MIFFYENALCKFTLYFLSYFVRIMAVLSQAYSMLEG